MDSINKAIKKFTFEQLSYKLITTLASEFHDERGVSSSSAREVQDLQERAVCHVVRGAVEATEVPAHSRGEVSPRVCEREFARHACKPLSAGRSEAGGQTEGRVQGA